MKKKILIAFIMFIPSLSKGAEPGDAETRFVLVPPSLAGCLSQLRLMHNASTNGGLLKLDALKDFELALEQLERKIKTPLLRTCTAGESLYTDEAFPETREEILAESRGLIRGIRAVLEVYRRVHPSAS